MPSPSTELSALIRAVETADSKAGIVMAVRQLAAAQDPAAIPMLITVLAYNNPGAAVAAVDGLVDLGSQAVPALLEQIDGYNYGARAWAIRALALIGDPRALPVLLDATAADFALSVRRAAARGLGTIRWSELPPSEAVVSQAQVLKTLMHTAGTDPEWVVRYAAVAGLHRLADALLPALAGERDAISTHLQAVIEQDDTPAVQARAALAVRQLVLR